MNSFLLLTCLFPRRRKTDVCDINNVHVCASSLQGSLLHSVSALPFKVFLQFSDAELRHSADEAIEILTDLVEAESLPLQVVKEQKPQRESFGRHGWFDEGRMDDDTQFYDMHELFEQCTLNAQRQAHVVSRSQKAIDAYVQEKGNIVGATGTAGIGKTTMIKLIARKRRSDAGGEAPPLIFHISLRAVDAAQPCTVLQFLTSSMLPDWDHTLECDKALLKKVNEADDVLIFIDGLDEARNFDLKNVAPSMKLFDVRNPEMIFKNLFSGKLLPKAKKFLTSRPGAYHDLSPQCKPEFTVIVIGLSKHSQDLLCAQLCESDEERKTIHVLISRNPNLSSLCFIPMFCRLTVLYLLKNIKSNLTHVCATDVFASFLDDCLRSPYFDANAEDILKLSQLALNSFVKNQLMFDMADLKKAGIVQACLEAFMHIDVVGSRKVRLKILDGHKRCFFAHLLWQEFFSAFYLMFDASYEEFTQLLNHLNENHWDSVVKFMCGFCREVVLRRIEPLVVDFSGKCFAEKVEALKSFLSKTAIQYRDCSVHSCPPATDFKELSRFSDRFKIALFSDGAKILKICSWVHELNDVNTTTTIANLFPENVLVSGSILPNDVTTMCDVLRAVQSRRLTLSFGTYSRAVNFENDDLRDLATNLCKTSHVVSSYVFFHDH